MYKGFYRIWAVLLFGFVGDILLICWWVALFVKFKASITTRIVLFFFNTKVCISTCMVTSLLCFSKTFTQMFFITLYANFNHSVNSVSFLLLIIMSMRLACIVRCVDKIKSQRMIISAPSTTNSRSYSYEFEAVFKSYW